MSFPVSPSNGQISIVNNIQYQYNSANNFWVRILTPTYFPSNFSITNQTASVSNTTGALTIAGGLGVGANVYANSIYANNYYFANGTVLSAGGGSSSGFLANSVIFANSTGVLVNVANLSFTTSNNTLIASNVTTPTIYTTSGGIVFPDGTSQQTSFNVAYNQANTAVANIAILYGINTTQNTWIASNSVFTQSAYNQANAATTSGVNAATSAQSAYDKANSANVLAQSSFNQANSASVTAQSSFNQANLANILAQSSFNQANLANVLAQSSFNQANLANVLAQSSFNQANSASVTAQSSFNQANLANILAQSSFNQANSANILAQSAFNNSNTKFSSSGGTVSGSVTVTNDLSVAGNLTIQGAYTYSNTTTYQSVDSLIQLAANNSSGDAVDIGFYGLYNNAGANNYAGLVRSAGSNFVLFKNIASNPSSNVLGTITLGNYGTLRANITGGVISGLANTIGVVDGGTGLSTLTAGYIPYGNGTSAFNSNANLAYDGTKVSITTTAAGSTAELLRLSNNGLGVNSSSQVSFVGSGTVYGSITGGYGPVYPQMTFNLPSATLGNYVWQNNSVESMRLDSSNNLSVTGSLTLGTKLTVGNGGTGLTSLTAGYIPYGNGTGAFSSSANLFFDGTNLGIGTSSPSSYSAKLVSYGGFGTSTPALSLVNSSAENANNIVETQYWLGNSFTGLVSVAKIGAISGATGNQYGSLYFSTSNTGAPTERMRIDSSGNVGIGTSSPSTYGKLAVISASGTQLFVGADSASNSVFRGFGIGITGTTAPYGSLQMNMTTGELKLESGNSGYGGFQTFYTAGSERMRIDSSGNVGIGTSSPTYFGATYTTLEVKGKSGSVGGYILASAADGSAITQIAAESSVSYVGSRTNTPLVFQTNNTERMRIDSSGNVGIGVVPSAWSGFRALQVGSTMSLWSLTSGNSSAFYSQNLYYNGSNRIALTTGTAVEYIQDLNGNHIWFNAPSVSAGSALTMTERMRIDSSGNVGIGVSSPTQILHLVGNQQLIRFNTTASSTTAMNASTTNSVIGISAPYGSSPATTSNAGAKWGITFTGNGDTPTTIGGVKSASVFAVSEDGGAGYNRAVGLCFFTSAFDVSQAERMRIDSSGNVGIGTTTPGYKLEVNGSFAATTKSFVINHPTKKGMKLRYGSLEGPENGVYIRGKLTDSNTIVLPEYWTKLIDENSITVQLTAIGKHQKLFVEDIVNNTVIIGNENIINKNINCFYVVFAERIDVEKLEVEVE